MVFLQQVQIQLCKCSCCVLLGERLPELYRRKVTDPLSIPLSLPRTYTQVWLQPVSEFIPAHLQHPAEAEVKSLISYILTTLRSFFSTNRVQSDVVCIQPSMDRLYVTAWDETALSSCTSA